jgi:hypothetical protein
MVRSPAFITLVLALISFFPLIAAHAVEKRISRNQLPVAVRKTADEQAAGATIRAYAIDVEHGRLEYEVELTINGHSKNVTIAPDGRVKEVEEQVDAGALPATVISALRNIAHETEITKIESITKNGAIVAYEAHMRTAGKHSEIRVGPSGESLSNDE